MDVTETFVRALAEVLTEPFEQIYDWIAAMDNGISQTNNRVGTLENRADALTEVLNDKLDREKSYKLEKETLFPFATNLQPMEEGGTVFKLVPQCNVVPGMYISPSTVDGKDYMVKLQNVTTDPVWLYYNNRYHAVSMTYDSYNN